MNDYMDEVTMHTTYEQAKALRQLLKLDLSSNGFTAH